MSALIPGEQRQSVLLHGEPMEDVDKFKYLGSMFIANGQGTEEIRSRINLARSPFCRLQSCLWPRREISLRTKARVYQAKLRSILLYSCETWPVRVSDVTCEATYEVSCHFIVVKPVEPSLDKLLKGISLVNASPVTCDASILSSETHTELQLEDDRIVRVYPTSVFFNLYLTPVGQQLPNPKSITPASPSFIENGQH